MSVPAAVTAAAAGRAPRPGYDASPVSTERRVLPMLAGERVVWLSTVCPDGRPHLVPTWFWWDGEALLFWSKPDAVKVRNLRANPQLMVALGDAGADFSVGLIEAAAELVEVPVPDRFFGKYGDALRAGGLDREAFVRLYTQAVRVVPTRFLAWHGRAERHAEPAATGIGDRFAGVLERVSVRLRGTAKALVVGGA